MLRPGNTFIYNLQVRAILTNDKMTSRCKLTTFLEDTEQEITVTKSIINRQGIIDNVFFILDIAYIYIFFSLKNTKATLNVYKPDSIL